MVCLTSCGSQGLPVYTVGARGWHPDRGLSLPASGQVLPSTEEKDLEPRPLLATPTPKAPESNDRRHAKTALNLNLPVPCPVLCEGNLL